MIKPLSQIISDGTLVDNTIHQIKGGMFRAGLYGAPIEVRQGRGGNNPGAVWPLMRKAAELDTKASKLVFRTPKPDYEHNTDDAFIRLEGIDPLDVTLTTGNLIGCVKHDGYCLRISSRFGDEFLKYIIADADGFVELPDHGGTDQGGYEWLLVYIWVVKLKKAFRLGLPKAYETHSKPLTQIRGRIDPVDYWKNHRTARYQCTYREHSYDNDATRLIARTLQHLDSHAFLRDAHILSHTFQTATEGRRNELRDLLATTPVRNPYYADYNSVIALSKQILRDELSDVGDQSQTNAFFFDVSMLFEYFIRKLLQRAGILFHNKSDRQWTIASGLINGERSLIPDLVFDRNGSAFVFDVKYKSFDFGYGVSREDLFQLHTYVGQIANDYQVAGCGFIYPIRESRWLEKGLGKTQGILTETMRQGGRTIPFHIVFIKVPEAGETSGGSWAKEFQKSFNACSKVFVNAFLDRVVLNSITPHPRDHANRNASIHHSLQGAERPRHF